MRVSQNLFDYLSQLRSSVFTQNQPATASTTQSQTASKSVGAADQSAVLSDSLARLLESGSPTEPSGGPLQTSGSLTSIDPPITLDPAVSADPGATGGAGTLTHTDPSLTLDPAVPANPNIIGSPAQPNAQPAVQNPTGTKPRGVIRLLQAGHFQGVADIRLRLNNFDELTALSLSAPTPPHGNGKAYDKFLAEYNAQLTPPEVNEVA